MSDGLSKRGSRGLGAGESASVPSADERGSSRISAYIMDATQAEIESVAEGIADLLVAHGFATAEESRCIVAADAWEWPDDPVQFARKVSEGAALIVIPQPPDDDLTHDGAPSGPGASDPSWSKEKRLDA